MVDAVGIPRVRSMLPGLELALRGETLFLANHSDLHVSVELRWTTPGIDPSQHALAPREATITTVARQLVS